MSISIFDTENHADFGCSKNHDHNVDKVEKI